MTEKHNLKPEQAQALEDLEKIRGNPIPKAIESLSEFSMIANPGFKLDGGDIIELSLMSKKFSTLPESIGHLTSLKKFYLGTKLKTLPQSIGNLSSLQELYLWGNQLSTLPESFGNLTSLERLYITDNKLTKLPESIGNLSSLKELNLSKNQLTTLPESIRNLSSLQKLKLSDNSFSTLPESIGNLESLQILELMRNKLIVLPESIGNLTSLKELWLSENELKTLPKSFWRLKNLERIFLKDNPWEGAWKGIEEYPAATVLERTWQITPIIIFLTHSKGDNEQYHVEELKNELKGQEGIRVVYSSIENDILESQLVLFIATKNSMNDEQCLQELKLATNHGISIIPIKGTDTKWDDLKQIDLGADFNLSDKLGIEFNDERVVQFYKELYRHIKKYRSEVNIFESEGLIFNHQWLIIKTIVNKFVESEEFKENYANNIDQYRKLNGELESEQISPVEYIIKWVQILYSKSN